MKISITSAACIALAAAAHSAPSNNHKQYHWDQLAFTAATTPAESLSSWLSKGLVSLVQPLINRPFHVLSTLDARLQSASGEDKTIYDVITENEEFSQLAKALKYASESTRDLLKGKTDARLTLFVPLNSHKHKDDDDDSTLSEVAARSTARASLAHGKASWAFIDQAIQNLEKQGGDDDEKKRRELALLIDAIFAYHLIDAERPLLAAQIVDNSTIATKLSIPENAAKIIGKLNDGLPLRIRVVKSLLPKPGLYLNFYSRIVYSDVKLANGILHAVQYPLFQFPSILTGLYIAQPEFSTLTTALLKTHSAGYLALPPKSHDHGLPHGTEADDELGHENHHASFSDPKGTPASTFFAPSNLAWDALPWAFRAYLFSPWGEKLLGKILMLHALPQDIVYADSVHHVRHQDKPLNGQVISKSVQRGSWFDQLDLPHGDFNVTKYTFDSVLPELKEGEPTAPPDKATEFETVDVEVFRYHQFPGGKGPIQTKLRVQNKIPVAISDVVNLNGASHLIDHFIKPKGHPHKGVWAEVAREARLRGFGNVDLVAEARNNTW